MHDYLTHTDHVSLLACSFYRAMLCMRGICYSPVSVFDRAHTTSYSTLVETMCLSCTVFEIKPVICRTSLILTHPTCICRPRRGWSRWNFTEIFGIRKLRLYYSASRWHSGNVMVGNITFLMIFCGLWSVAVNTMDKLQFLIFTMYNGITFRK